MHIKFILAKAQKKTILNLLKQCIKFKSKPVKNKL